MTRGSNTLNVLLYGALLPVRSWGPWYVLCVPITVAIFSESRCRFIDARLQDDEVGLTPLHLAAYKGRIGVCYVLVSQCSADVHAAAGVRRLCLCWKSRVTSSACGGWPGWAHAAALGGATRPCECMPSVGVEIRGRRSGVGQRTCAVAAVFSDLWPAGRNNSVICSTAKRHSSWQKPTAMRLRRKR